MQNKTYLFILIFCISFQACNKSSYIQKVSDSEGETISDIDGNDYQTVKIGSQTWMKENLKTTKFRDGSEIPNNIGNSSWGMLNGSACAEYPSYTSSETDYGILYNWYATNDIKAICPKGWHIPSLSEWQILISFCGGANEAARVLRIADQDVWSNPNVVSTNKTEFTALPGGLRSSSGSIEKTGDEGHWWTSTDNINTASEININSFSDFVNTKESNKNLGLSVRCIKN